MRATLRVLPLDWPRVRGGRGEPPHRHSVAREAKKAHRGIWGEDTLGCLGRLRPGCDILKP